MIGCLCPLSLCFRGVQHRGNTPLHFCFQFGYGDSLGQYLISKGANVNIRNNDGFTCFDDPASLQHAYR